MSRKIAAEDGGEKGEESALMNNRIEAEDHVALGDDKEGAKTIDIVVNKTSNLQTVGSIDEEDDDDDYVVMDENNGTEEDFPTNKEDANVVWLRSKSIRRPTRHFAKPKTSDTMRWSVKINGDISSGRKRAIAELLATEESYCLDLTQVQEGYIHALSEQSLTGIEKKAIFENWEDLVVFHREFSRSLQYSATTTPTQIGRCFLEVDLLSLYSDICVNHDRQLDVLKEREDNDQRFCAELQACQKALGHLLPLKDYLLKPVQRIMRYQLLLSEQIKQCTLHNAQGKTVLLRARDMLLDVVRELNERRRLAQLQDLIKGNLAFVRGRGLRERLEGLSVELTALGPLLAFYEDAKLQVDARSKKWRKLLCFSEGIIACKGKGATDRLTVKAEYNLATCELRMLGGAKFSLHVSATEWDTYSLSNEESGKLLMRVYNKEVYEEAEDGNITVAPQMDFHVEDTGNNNNVGEEVESLKSPKKDSQQVSSKKSWGLAKLQKRERVFSWNHKSRKSSNQLSQNTSLEPLSPSHPLTKQSSSSAVIKKKFSDEHVLSKNPANNSIADTFSPLLFKEGTDAEIIRDVMQRQIDVLFSKLQEQKQEMQVLVHENGCLHASLSGTDPETEIRLESVVVTSRTELKQVKALSAEKDVTIARQAKELEDVKQSELLLENDLRIGVEEIERLKYQDSEAKQNVKELSSKVAKLGTDLEREREQAKLYKEQMVIASQDVEKLKMTSATQISKLGTALQSIERLVKEVEEEKKQKDAYAHRYAEDKRKATAKIAELEDKIVSQQLKFSTELSAAHNATHSSSMPSSSKTSPVASKETASAKKSKFGSLRRLTRRRSSKKSSNISSSSSESTHVSVEGTNKTESSTDLDVFTEATQDGNNLTMESESLSTIPEGRKQNTRMFEDDEDTSCLIM
eukprot:m.114284 g.114284  ORF g.114284 m.114284 type:complete len:916 (-) comp9278_c0_seq1:2043-4790(-)